MTPEEFYARRRAANLTMEKAASLLGVSLKTIWRYESGAIAIPALRCAAIRSTLPRLEAEPVVA